MTNIIMILNKYTTFDYDTEEDVEGAFVSLAALVDDENLEKAKIMYETFIEECGNADRSIVVVKPFTGPENQIVSAGVPVTERELAERMDEIEFSGNDWPGYGSYTLGRLNKLEAEDVESPLIYEYHFDPHGPGVEMSPSLPRKCGYYYRREAQTVKANSLKEALANVFEIRRSGREQVRGIRI